MNNIYASQVNILQIFRLTKRLRSIHPSFPTSDRHSSRVGHLTLQQEIRLNQPEAVEVEPCFFVKGKQNRDPV